MGTYLLKGNILNYLIVFIDYKKTEWSVSVTVKNCMYTPGVIVIMKIFTVNDEY